jgi:uncharacterized protein (TIGR03437 family)
MRFPKHLIHHVEPRTLNRRRTLAILGGGAAAALVGRAAACLTPNPAMEEGPFFVDEKLLRSDVRSDPSTGVVQAGVLLTLAVTIQNQNGGACVPLAGAYVDIWQCNALGIYSDEASENSTGVKYLRGYQITDDNGLVQFTTIYPGWYSGRTVHIHLRVRTYTGATVLSDFETQSFFDDAITDVVYTQAPYNTRGTRDTVNSTDRVYTGASDASLNLWNLTQTASGYAATLNLAVNETAPAATLPVIAAGGVSNAASGAAGVSPGAWTSIFGTNLAASTQTLTSAGIVNNLMPTTLGGVSVQIDGNAAFLDYVSPTQINVLSPADANTGSVAVTVMNSAGTSAAVATTLEPILPGLFTSSNYVSAVRVSDGALLSATIAAKVGDVIELYGTGFGPTTTSVTTGLVFTGAYPTSNLVTVTIGGISAVVSFAGLVGPGLHQINLTVPAGVGAGDNAVVATVGGFSTQSTALLKVAA